MPTLASGSNITLTLTDYDSVTVSTQGVVLIDAISGLGVTAGRIAELTGVRTFGPYIAGQFKLTAQGAAVQYEVADGVAPTAGGGSAITVNDEGVLLTAALSSINYVGAGITATNTGGAVTVTVPGGGATVITTVTAGATPAINSDVSDIAVISGMTVAITSMTTNLTGTPVDCETLEIHFKDNGTARVIAWGTKFIDSSITLPTTTVAGVRLRVYLQWDALLATPAWVCVGKG